MKFSLQPIYRLCPKLICFLATLSLTACGSGGDDGEEPFTPGSGRWSGQMRQLGGATCSDGSFIGAGAGVKTREVILLIRGGDNTGAVASMTFDNCEYIGFRESMRNMTFRSNSSNCFAEIVFTEIRLDSANIRFIPSAVDSLSTNGKPICTIEEEGVVNRSA